MKHRLDWILRLWVATTLALPGCALQNRRNQNSHDDDGYFRSVATEIEYPDSPVPSNPQACESMSPDSVGAQGPPEYWDISLDEAMQAALNNSTVLRDLGATLLRTPSNVRSIQGVAITESDPRYGVEAALSEFDANFATRVLTEKNDRAVNNVFVGGGTTIVRQDLAVFQSAITKRTVSGGTLAIRHNTDYDANNAPANTFPSAWNTNFEVEARQSLLKDAGATFNRIAGPNSVTNANGTGSSPGFYNGVLIARINTDITLADFEAGVRDFASNVENAYWDLYLAYRDLDAKIHARDSALESWRRVHALFTAGRAGGEAEKEAEAREQYFRFEEEVQNSLSGRLIDGTQTFNGSSGGTQRQIPGVRVAERRLRLLMGVPISDGRLLRPADEPRMAKMVFDWDEVVHEALARRVELRRQRWTIKRRELELIASKNYLLPSLDLTGRYRWRGFGHDLISTQGGDPEFANAYSNLLSGNFQEWQMGMEFNMPIGFRKGHAAVRNAQLMLARDRSLLCEQERSVIHDLTNVFADLERAYQVSQTSFNRRNAAQQQLAAMQAAYESDQVPFFQVLDAQRRLAESESRFSLAQVEYALATKNVHFEKGTLLDYNQIFLSEGPWPDKAYRDAMMLRPQKRILDYTLNPGPVSEGPMAQGILTPDGESPTSMLRPSGHVPDELPLEAPVAAPPEASSLVPPRGDSSIDAPEPPSPTGKTVSLEEKLEAALSPR